jgi:hypothetical protein
VKEIGILFTPDNIRAIRELRKTQTRRTINPHPGFESGGEMSKVFRDNVNFNGGRAVYKCPYGVPGDRLYIKEGIIRHASIPQLVGYYMDGCRVTEHWEKRMTAMFMPKWAARTWLEITDVRVQRLQDISEADAKAEGPSLDGGPWILGGKHETYRAAFFELWDSININAKKHPWVNNDWVWAITFRKVTP